MCTMLKSNKVDVDRFVVENSQFVTSYYGRHLNVFKEGHLLKTDTSVRRTLF